MFSLFGKQTFAKWIKAKRIVAALTTRNPAVRSVRHSFTTHRKPQFREAPHTFWLRVQRAPARLLILDYDGTLAPFHPQRDQAYPYTGVREALQALQETGRTEIALVSGRPSKDVARLLRLPTPLEIWGNHGWERLSPQGRLERFALPANARSALRLAAAVLREAWGETVWEIKAYSVAAHRRGMTPVQARALSAWARRIWGPLAKTHGLVLHRFDGGYEIRAPQHDKGSAVRTLLSHHAMLSHNMLSHNMLPDHAMLPDHMLPDHMLPDQLPHRTMELCCAYLGDDRTDEDAFLALESTLGRQALSVLVRPRWRTSVASLWLKPPQELLKFLTTWAQWSRTTRPPPPQDG